MCERKHVVQEKSYTFALEILKLCRWLSETKKEYVISKQLLKSGTSIGANVEEAIGAQSRKDFHAKLTIACKEARETHFWIRLLQDADILDRKIAEKTLNDCTELLKLLTSILRTLQAKIKIIHY